MIINTAGQKIGAQMVAAADGSAFTGAVTVAVTIDAGSQAAGTVGSAACTHEGNGYHTYAPDQAETNGSLIAFTFIGTGAIPATVQVFTRAGDAFTRLGAPAGASVSADIAAIEAQTDDIGAAGAGLTALASAANLATAATYIDTEVAAILALLDDARGEPAQGAPGVSVDLATKIDYLYKWARNKKDNDGSVTNYYADNGSTIDHKQTTTEAAGTVTVGEMATGA